MQLVQVSNYMAHGLGTSNLFSGPHQWKWKVGNPHYGEELRDCGSD